MKRILAVLVLLLLQSLIAYEARAANISGNVQSDMGNAISGVTMTLSGAANSTTTTSLGGFYSFSGLSNGTYTVTPSRTGWTFSPASQTVTLSGTSKTLPLFVGTSTASFNLSGFVRNASGGGISGVTVSLSGSASKTTTTTSTGAYSFSVLNGSYTVTPSSSGYSCIPSSQSTSISGASKSLPDFTCTPVHSLSGIVKSSSGTGLSGINVLLSGAASRSTTTSSSGAFTFSGLVDGSYTVRPSSSAWTCSPTSQAVSLAGANRQLPDFICSPAGGSLSVSVRNVDGVARSAARCVLYDNNYQTLGSSYERTSNGSGVCSWSSLPAGSYWVEAYYSAGPSPFGGEEYWGNLNLPVQAGANTSRDLNRSEPYAAGVEIRLGNSSGPLLTSSSVLAPNSSVWVAVRVLQTTGIDKSSTVQVVLDRERDSAYDRDTGPSSAQTVVSGSSGRTFSFTITVQAPGTYFFAPAVRTQETTLTFTDRWDWTPTFTVQDPQIDLEASSIDVSPPNLTAGDPVTITGVIRNQGTATSPAFNWLLALNGNLIDSGRPASLAADGAITGASISWSGTLPPGEYRVDLAADTDQEIQEVSEGNNTRTVYFSVTPRYGTTVITHGFQLTDGSDIQWACDMAEAILRRAGGGKVLFYDKTSGRFLDYPDLSADSAFRSKAACRQPSFAGPSNGETVLVFDWILESNNPYQGYTESAGAALFAALVDPVNDPYVDLDHLHLIGHSRGTVVNSEAVERLITANKPAPERVTMLDPVDDYPNWSDLDVNYEQPYRSQGVVAWSAGSTDYETYFQTREYFPLTGHAIPGSKNLDLTASFLDPLCLSPSHPGCIPHSWVHAWYHFTIDHEADAASVLDGSHLTAAWFGTGERSCSAGTPGSRAQEGFAFSRLGGELTPCPVAGSRTAASFDFGSPREGIVNGDFARGGDAVNLPGWEQHGGGGSGKPAFLGDNSLELAAGYSTRVHDRAYVPSAADQMTFMLRVKQVEREDLADVLRVVLVSATGNIELTSKEFELTDTTGFTATSIDIPESLRGGVVRPEFLLLPRGDSADAVVQIDNVYFHLIGTPTLPHVLNVDLGGDGSGQVASGDGGITCGALCRAAYAGDQTVALTATPSPGSLFTGWTGDPDCLDGVVTMTGNLSCTADFTASVARPAAPTWLRTTATSPSTIDLLWDDNSSDEEGFKVERKEGPAGPWTVVATLPADATYFQDTAVYCGIPWAYRVWAFNAAGESDRTNEAGATPECQCVEALDPGSKSLDAAGGSGSFAVTACGSWTAVSDAGWIEITSGASGTGNGTVSFRVARNSVQSPRTGTISLPELGLVFNVQQAAAPADPGFTSFLRLVSGTVAGQAVDPDHHTVTVTPGAAVSGSLDLRIDSSFGSNAVMALGISPSWGDHATSYTDLGHFSTPASGLIRNVAINYTAPATPGTYHVLAAFRGEFNAGQVMSATNWGVGTLVWNNGDDLADWSDERIATANQDGTVLADYLLSGGNVPMWVPATAITIVVEAPSVQRPADPSWLRATPFSPASIDLLWDDNSNNEDGFKVERKEGPAGPWTVITTLPSNATTYQDTGLTCGTTYAYRVWAFNAAGDSGKTNEAGTTPVCFAARMAPRPRSPARGGRLLPGREPWNFCRPWRGSGREGLWTVPGLTPWAMSLPPSGLAVGDSRGTPAFENGDRWGPSSTVAWHLFGGGSERLR